MMIQFKRPGCCVFQSALYQTTTTVVDTPDLVLVVDPNWLPAEVEAIRHYVEGIRNGRPLYLLFTHSDYDHIIGYRAFPGAQTIASRAFVENPDREKVLEQIRRFDDENYIERSYPLEYPTIDLVVERDGQTMTVGTTSLNFFLAPGHNADGIMTVVGPSGVWLAGDYLCEVEFPFVYHSFADYEKTLDKAVRIMEDQKPDLLVPGHGKVAVSPQEMTVRIEEALTYLRQLKAAVLKGQPFPEDELWRRYRFPLNMKTFHQDNEKLLRKELGLEK